jgi:excinuclease ABC subunit C
MVVYTQGQKDSSQYRRFKIKSTVAKSDPQRLREVIERRTKHLEWSMPDLIILDGGAQQLKGVIGSMPWDIPLIGLVKNPDRLVFPHTANSKTTFTFHKFVPTNPATRLFTSIRDESHRFANTYQQLLYQKSLTDS